MFLRKTIFYVNKNIIFLLLLSIPAAACFTLGGKPLSIVEFFVDMFGNIQSGQTGYSFYSIFINFSIIDFQKPLLILFMVLGWFFMGIIFSLVERNMKYHTISVGSFRSLLLDALFITLPAGILFVFIIELVGVIISGFIALFALLGHSWLWFGLSVGTTVIAYYIFISFMSYLVCWVPCISMEGLKFSMASSLSARMVSKQHTKIFATIGVIVLIQTGLVFAVNLAGIVSYFVLCAVLNMLMCMYLPAYCYNAYFKLADIPQGAKRR